MMLGSYAEMIAGTIQVPFDMLQVVEWLGKSEFKGTGDEYDWVPNSVIQDAWIKAGIGLLNPKTHSQRFGVAVRIGVTYLDKYGVAIRVNRRIGSGQRVRGWAMISGPGSLRSPEYR